MLSVVLKFSLAPWTARLQDGSPNAGVSEWDRTTRLCGEGATLLSSTRDGKAVINNNTKSNWGTKMYWRFI